MDEGIFISLTDEEGQNYRLEVMGEVEFGADVFGIFLPADMDEDDPDYGIVILRSVVDENGDELFESIDDDAELQDEYEHFAILLFDDEDEE